MAHTLGGFKLTWILKMEQDKETSSNWGEDMEMLSEPEEDLSETSKMIWEAVWTDVLVKNF